MSFTGDMTALMQDMNRISNRLVTGNMHFVFVQMMSTAPELTGALKRNLTMKRSGKGKSVKITQKMPNRAYPRIMNLGMSNVKIFSGDPNYFITGMGIMEQDVKDALKELGTLPKRRLKAKYSIGKKT